MTMIRNSAGRTVRSASEPVAEELDALGISPGTQIATFFASYVATNLSSPVSGEELLDLCSPTPQIRETTDWLRDMNEEFYQDFIALTSFEAEGGYLYNIRTGEVLEHSWPDVVDAIWPSFNSFMQWYLTGAQ